MYSITLQDKYNQSPKFGREAKKILRFWYLYANKSLKNLCLLPPSFVTKTWIVIKNLINITILEQFLLKISGFALFWFVISSKFSPHSLNQWELKPKQIEPWTLKLHKSPFFFLWCLWSAGSRQARKLMLFFVLIWLVYWIVCACCHRLAWLEQSLWFWPMANSMTLLESPNQDSSRLATLFSTDVFRPPSSFRFWSGVPFPTWDIPRSNWGVLIYWVFTTTREMYVATWIMVKTFFDTMKLFQLNWLITGPWNTYFLGQVRRVRARVNGSNSF